MASRGAGLNAPVTGTSWKTLPLPLIRSATISLPSGVRAGVWESGKLRPLRPVPVSDIRCLRFRDVKRAGIAEADISVILKRALPFRGHAKKR